jgi:hypothetical protein
MTGQQSLSPSPLRSHATFDDYSYGGTFGILIGFLKINSNIPTFLHQINQFLSFSNK